MARSKVSKSATTRNSKDPGSASKPATNPGADDSPSKSVTSPTDSANSLSAPVSPPENNGKPPGAKGLVAAAGAVPGKSHADEVADKIKELLRLAQEQGYLTYGDINDALPDNAVTPERLDEICIKLRNLDVDIVDQ